MQTQEFDQLVAQCQPHTLFTHEFMSYWASDFAHKFLAKIIPYEATKMLVYDGAELFERVPKATPQEFALDNGKKPEVYAYTYPEGVPASEKRQKIDWQSNEVGIFMELSKDEKVKINLNFGRDLEVFLEKHFRANKIPKRAADLRTQTYHKTLTEVQDFFKESLLQDTLMRLVFDLVGVDIFTHYPKCKKQGVVTNTLYQLCENNAKNLSTSFKTEKRIHDMNGKYGVNIEKYVELVRNYNGLKNVENIQGLRVCLEWEFVKLDTGRLTHVVTSGEDINSLATRYKIFNKTLILWNRKNYPTLEAGYIATGWVLFIEPEIYEIVEDIPPNTTGKLWKHKVRRGDSLWGVANMYQVKLKDLKSWNGFEPDDNAIYPGEVLRIYTNHKFILAPGKFGDRGNNNDNDYYADGYYDYEYGFYVSQKPDTFYSIARRFYGEYKLGELAELMKETNEEMLGTTAWQLGNKDEVYVLVDETIFYKQTIQREVQQIMAPMDATLTELDRIIEAKEQLINMITNAKGLYKDLLKLTQLHIKVKEEQIRILEKRLQDGYYGNLFFDILDLGANVALTIVGSVVTIGFFIAPEPFLTKAGFWWALTGTFIAADNVQSKFRLIWGKIEGTFEPGDDYSGIKYVLESLSEAGTGYKDTGYWLYQGATFRVGGRAVINAVRGIKKGEKLLKNRTIAISGGYLRVRQILSGFVGLDDEELYEYIFGSSESEEEYLKHLGQVEKYLEELEEANKKEIRKFYEWLNQQKSKN